MPTTKRSSSFAATQQVVQVGEKLAPVRQIGEDIEIGEAKVLRGQAERLQMFFAELFLKIDHIGEIARMGQDNVDHRHRDQRPIDSHRDKSRASNGHQNRRTGHNPDDRHDERGGPHMHQAEDAADHGDRQEKNHLPLGVGVAVGKERDPPDQEQHG